MQLLWLLKQSTQFGQSAYIMIYSSSLLYEKFYNLSDTEFESFCLNLNQNNFCLRSNEYDLLSKQSLWDNEYVDIIILCLQSKI